LTRETIFMICEKLKELMHRPKSSSLIKM
jgi:hypothetical protein